MSLLPTRLVAVAVRAILCEGTAGESPVEMANEQRAPFSVIVQARMCLQVFTENFSEISLYQTLKHLNRHPNTPRKMLHERHSASDLP